MRIFWIGPWRADALSTQVRGSMARALHDAGNEIGTVVIGEPGSWKTGGYDWFHYCPVPKTAFGKWVNQARICRSIAGFNGDVLVLGEKAAQLAAVAAAARKLLGKKWRIVIDVRTLPIPGSERKLESRGRRFWKQLKMGFPYVDAWMAITPRLRDVVRQRVTTRDLPCLIWESAVDVAFTTGCEQETCLMANRISACGHETNILYLGSLNRGRRIDLPIRAMAEMVNESARVGLHIVGSGDHVADLKRIVEALGLSRTVHMWDSVQYIEVPPVIRSCDLGILPLPDCDAWNTSSALKLYEYMGVGRPILVSDIPAHRHAVDGQPFAFFMNEYSTTGYIAALTQFLQTSKDDRKRSGEQARTFVRENHTWDHRARVIHGFLANLQAGLA